MSPDHRRWNAVIFDLDGTLVDSKPGIVACLRRTLADLGLDPPDPNELDWAIGPPLDEVMARLLGEQHAPLQAEGVRRYREIYGATGLFEAQIYEGVPDMLDRLHSAGYRLAVATNKLESFARRMMSHVGLLDRFESVQGTRLDEGQRRKPELIREAIQAIGVMPETAVMVGDREQDIFGARANRLRSIGVLYGYGSRDELLMAGADDLCHSPRDLPYLL